jgi:ABC-type branched-subunit amino acid transport system substrate-binding protein
MASGNFERGEFMRRLFLVLVALAVAGLSLGLSACGGDDGGDGGGAATLDLTIGDSVPLTGALSPYGPPGQKAADVAIEQINAAIDDVGADHTVDIIHEDNETLPTPAVNVARSMVDEGASCIAGAWASADTIPTARSVAIRQEVLLISPSSTSDEITALEDNGLVNRTAPPDKYQGPTLADAIEEDIGGAEGKVVNIGARNDSYGEGLSGTFSDAWEAKGGQIGETVLYDPEQPSYDSEARQIVSGNPDTIVIIDFPETFANVGPALLRTGDYDPANAWGTDGLTIGPVRPPEIVAGMQATAPGSPDAGAVPEAFADVFAQSDPADVEQAIFAAQNFDAVILCYLAAVAAGSTDGQEMADQLRDISGPPGDKYSFEDLAGAIEALENGDDIDYEGAAGAIDLDEAGDPTSGVYDINEFQPDGELREISEVPVPEL